MDITAGRYQAVKDTSMQSGVSCWLLPDGGEIELTQIDNCRKKALFVCGRDSDWISFNRIRKCFKKVSD